jgi:uncharacterized membrane protein YcaP (DUF421 family)
MSDVDWAGLFSFSVPVAEIAIRGTAMYWFLFVLFRFVVRRDAGGVGMADILVLVIVADAAQNGLAGEYRSITDGMLLVSVIVFWDYLVDWFAYRSGFLQRLLQARPLLLIKDGRLQHHNLRRHLLTREDVEEKLREQGVADLKKVRRAYLESDGKFSVITR